MVKIRYPLIRKKPIGLLLQRLGQRNHPKRFRYYSLKEAPSAIAGLPGGPALLPALPNRPDTRWCDGAPMTSRW